MTAAPTPTNTSDRALREAIVHTMEETFEATIHLDESKPPELNFERVADAVIAGPIAALRAEIERLKDRAIDLDAESDQLATRVREVQAAHDTLASELGRTCGELMTRGVAIQRYLDGDYDHPRRHRPDKCRHGIWFYDTCEQCIDDHFLAALGKPLAETPCPDAARYDRGECCGGACSSPQRPRAALQEPKS